jgi:hypothetical protein
VAIHGERNRKLPILSEQCRRSRNLQENQPGLLRYVIRRQHRNPLAHFPENLVDGGGECKEKQLLPDHLEWPLRDRVDQCVEDFASGILVRRSALLV